MRMSLAERIQLERADEQMHRPARELLFDTVFQQRCSDGYWRGKFARTETVHDLLRGQLTLFRMEPDGTNQERRKPEARRARGPRLRAGEGSGWLVGFEDAARAG